MTAAAQQAGFDRKLISPMVLLELEYLYELKRTARPGREVLETLRLDVGLQVCDLPFDAVVLGALGQSWTRDPFDRLIVSQASLRRAPLLTKDRSIHEHYPRAVWGE